MSRILIIEGDEQLQKQWSQNLGLAYDVLVAGDAVQARGLYHDYTDSISIIIVTDQLPSVRDIVSQGRRSANTLGLIAELRRGGFKGLMLGCSKDDRNDLDMRGAGCDHSGPARDINLIGLRRLQHEHTLSHPARSAS